MFRCPPRFTQMPYSRIAAAIAGLFLLASVVSVAVSEEDASNGYRGGGGMSSKGFAAPMMATASVMMADDDAGPEMYAEDMAMADGPMPPPMAARSAGAPRMRSTSAARGESRSARSEGREGLGASVFDEVGKPTFDAAAVPKMLRRTGDVRLETAADVFGVGDAAAAAAEARGGHVERRSDDGGWVDDQGMRRGRSSTLTLRVPVEAFGEAMRSFKVGVGGSAPGDVRTLVDATTDVTADYVDAASRAATLEATRDRLLALMRSADSVKDVLAVQRELASVAQQLEAKKNVASRLSKAAALSTIHLRVDQKDPERIQPPPKHRRPFLIRTYARAFAWLGGLLEKAATIAVFLSVAAIPTTLLLAVARMLSTIMLCRQINRL